MSQKRLTKRIPYIERDESWMYFNKRLLVEASRRDIPLLERLHYLGIYANNLDEFFRVRVASLRRILEYGIDLPMETRAKTLSTLRKITILNEEYNREFDEIWDQLVVLLQKEDLYIIDEESLSERQKREVLSYYMNNLNGVTNPIFLDSSSFVPEQHLKDSLYFVVEMEKEGSETVENVKDLSLIEIPVKELGRFIRLENEGNRSFIMFIDDVIRYCLPYIFIGLDYDRYTAYTFKFTKDAELEIETDQQYSVLQKVSQGLIKRKRGIPIRLVYDHNMPEYVFRKIYRMAELNDKDTVVGSHRYPNMSDLMKFPDCGRTDLKYEPQPPLFMGEIQYSQSVINQILNRDMGIHLPYYSFDHFLRVLREAAISRDVTSIHVTLYRLAQNSKVVKALVAAAQNGKHVTAVVELMARFDEASNINWSKKMQDAGIKVIFGHEKLKIHSKLVHITTTKGCIACIGSGNMHEGTARLYTDYMLMTANKRITDDVYKVFEFIDKPFLNVKFNELLVSPNEMRRKLYLLINREIKFAQQGKPAYIKIKINHIVDPKMVKKLYEASQSGVKIELCLRGNCSIIPGEKGFSENITINAIIDRYLEHSRIYIFGNGGNPRYFIGSADWMPRNLDKRIEVIVPIYDKDIQQELLTIVDAGLMDTSHGYYVNINDGLPKRTLLPTNKKLYRSQTDLYKRYKSKLEQHN